MTPDGHFYLGGVIDPESGERTGDPVHLEASDLTTHGVIVGMTGSGKTGLSVIMLEEALLQDIPTIIIDPKGDMGNLLLTFPELASSDFEPWINPADAERDGVSLSEHAAATADMWRNGLESWDIGPERIKALRDKAEFTIYTPGSTSGIPLNIIGDLSAPSDAEPEALADEVEGLASSLLGLVDIEADPLSSREHILLSNLIHRAWSEGKSLDLATLLGQIQNPPMRKLGVLELDTFFPPKDRTALVMKLNGLLASPAFASWTEGAPLDIEAMLSNGPRCSIISIAHLAESERQFVVTLVLSRIVTWMRAQPGTPELRALVYMDEVFGYVPPTARPPSKKPILTILKQARAFGVGLVLATQNPVDIDYKAISNAGTWMVGRLQTERDKDRLLDGMTAAGGGSDKGKLSDLISALDKRQFLLHQTRSDEPTVFGTRWAMSYLPGPLTRSQIGELTDTSGRRAEIATAESSVPSRAASAPEEAVPELADDESTMTPDIADGVPVRYVDPGAPWLDTVGGSPEGRRLVAGVASRVKLLFDDTKADLRHEVEWEAVISPIADEIDPDDAVEVDFDERDLRTDPTSDDLVYVLPEAKIHTKTLFSSAKTQLKGKLYREQALALFTNRELKITSRVGETEADFLKRCDAAAEDLADADVAKLRTSLEKKMDRIRVAIEKAEDRVRELEQDADSRSKDQVLDLATSVLGSVLGGRRSTRSILGGARRASSRQRMKSNAKQRLETAENRLGEKVDELDDLETELTDSLFEIQADWDDRSKEIESIEVPLEKTDITIDDFTLVWIPTD
ncbi:MAG: helicase HerA domain-containing protein [Acidimicrobiales bacterium]